MKAMTPNEKMTDNMCVTSWYIRCHSCNNNSGAKKRFSFTGTGKIKRHHAYHSHILTKKTKKQKRNLLGSTLVDHDNMKQVRDLLRLR